MVNYWFGKFRRDGADTNETRSGRPQGAVAPEISRIFVKLC